VIHPRPVLYIHPELRPWIDRAAIEAARDELGLLDLPMMIQPLPRNVTTFIGDYRREGYIGKARLYPDGRSYHRIRLHRRLRWPAGLRADIEAERAAKLSRVLWHELAHAQQYATGRIFEELADVGKGTGRQRRPAYRKRPCEVEANAMEVRAQTHPLHRLPTADEVAQVTKKPR
jgi:hypothetical protein